MASRKGVTLVPIDSTVQAPEAPTFGHVARTCDGCGAEWMPPQCGCGSFIFTERATEAQLVTAIGYRGARAVFGRMLGIGPRSAYRPDASDLEALADLIATLLAAEATLSPADAALRRLVNAGDRAAMRWGVAQRVTAQATSAAGDWMPALGRPSRFAQAVRACRRRLESGLADPEGDRAAHRVTSALEAALPSLARDQARDLGYVLAMVATGTEPLGPDDLSAVRILVERLAAVEVALQDAALATRRVAAGAREVVRSDDRPSERRAEVAEYASAILAESANLAGDFDLANYPESLALVSRGLRHLISETIAIFNSEAS